jgi:acyl-CoA synthetase (AMP-forming)/AMP-acid ligase II
MDNVLRPTDAPRSVPEAIANWATVTPDAVALLAPDRPPTTYRELHEAIDRLAGELRALGLGRQDGIALICPEGPELCLAFLAAMTAGIAVPLPWPAPDAEYRRVLASRRIRAVLVSTTIPPLTLEQDGRPLPVVTLTAGSSGRLGAFLLTGPRWGDAVAAAPPDPDGIAVILHSSGTTGPSKLVPLLHRNTVASCRTDAAERAITAADRILDPAKLAYSLGLITFITTLFYGATYISVPGPDLAAMPDWLQRFRPTYLVAAPALLRAFADHDELREAVQQAPLRCITTSAAPLSADDVLHLESALGAPILGMYGLSESSCLASEPYPPRCRVPGSVGLPTCEIRIVDEHAEPLALQQHGEIVVRGPQVFPGYLDDPEANARTFLPGGWFRTGDIGYFDDAGYLYLSGRLREIINRGGEKIVPREVDDVLLAHPAVADAAVFAVPDPLLGEDVVAAVVLRPGAIASPRKLRSWMLDRLVSYKAPRRIWLVESLHRTTTGKVQRGELARRWSERS